MRENNATRDYYTRQYDEARLADAKRHDLLAAVHQLTRAEARFEIDLTDEAANIAV